jgi:hypothetical protein
MKSTSSLPNNTKALLAAFLHYIASLQEVRRSDLFNPTVSSNSPFLRLFGESGPLDTKDKRDAFFEIMKANGTSVRDGNVIFSPEFSSRIDSIVRQFLQGIDDSQSSSDVANSAGQPNATVATAGGSAVCQRKPSGKPNATVATAGGGAACQKKTSGQLKEAVATAGGGAAFQKKPAGQPKEAVATAGRSAAFHKGHPKPMTLADFQAKSESSKTLKCVLCQHTDKDSGKCKFSNCSNVHPLNPKSVVFKEISSKGRQVLLAKVCENYQNDSCVLNETCTHAHISPGEYAMVLENEQRRRELKAECPKVSKVSSEKQRRPSGIVPSQVHFGRPSQSSALPAPVSHLLEIPGYSFDPIDPFLRFLDVDIFARWSSVVSEKNPDAVDVSHQGTSAVEVFDSSSDDEEDVEGDE